MNINDLKASANLENKAKGLERIFVGNKSACRPQHFVDFLQMNYSELKQPSFRNAT